jgi:hypothetical protein
VRYVPRGEKPTEESGSLVSDRKLLRIIVFILDMSQHSGNSLSVPFRGRIVVALISSTAAVPFTVTVTLGANVPPAMYSVRRSPPGMVRLLFQERAFAVMVADLFLAILLWLVGVFFVQHDVMHTLPLTLTVD